MAALAMPRKYSAALTVLKKYLKALHTLLHARVPERAHQEISSEDSKA